ncbi:hypothetical protein [Streptomyces sp. NPDC003667]
MVAEAGQQVENLGRLRAGGDVAGEHDVVGGADVWFGEHCLQGRQDSVTPSYPAVVICGPSLVTPEAGAPGRSDIVSVVWCLSGNTEEFTR